MLAGSVAQQVLQADAAATVPDAVLTDRLEFDIESALESGWRPGRTRRPRASRRFCGLRHRRHRPADDAIFRP